MEVENIDVIGPEVLQAVIKGDSHVLETVPDVVDVLLDGLVATFDVVSVLMQMLVGSWFQK